VAFFFAGFVIFVAAKGSYLRDGGRYTEEGMRGILWSCSALLAGTLNAFCGAAIFQKVVLSGEVAPGVAGGSKFSSFNSAQIDADGNVAFRAATTGAGGIWRIHNDSLAKVVAGGDTVPSRDGLISVIERFTLTPSGHILFVAVTTSSFNQRGIWFDDAGAFACVAAQRDAVPGVPSTWFNFGISTFPTIDDAGRVIFTPTLELVGPVTASNNDGVWRWDSGVISNVLREGDPAPGVSPGVIFSTPSSAVLPQIANGKVAVLTGLAGTNISSSNNAGIWVQDGATLQKIVQKGDAAPGGGTFSTLPSSPSSPFALAITISGEVYFTANLSTGAKGIFQAKDGVIASVVLANPAVAGDPWIYDLGAPRITSSGRMAFLATMRSDPGTFHDAIWSWSDGQLQTIVTAGDTTPELGPDIQFKTLASSGMELLENNQGQILFSAVVGRANENGLRSVWSYDPESGIHYLARVGDSFQVAPGDVRTINSIAFPANFNDSGQFAVTFGFADVSSGVFLKSVPEPAAGVVLLIFISTFPSRTRPRKSNKLATRR
jgi:hypothetical protein